MAASTTLTPEQRSMRASIAACARWKREDPKPNAERGQRGLRDKFRREIAEQHPELGPAELDRRAECAYREHMTRLQFASSKARRARRGATTR